MHCDGIPIVVDRCGRPIAFSELRWSSARSSWAGFPLEAYRVGPSGRLTDFTVPHALLALCTVGRAEIRIRGSGPERRPVSVPGRLFVLGRGYELESVSWSGTCELLCVEVCSWRRGVLKEPADDLSEVALAPQFAISEPQLAALILNMRAEIEAGCPAGRLYGESLSLAMAAYLSGRYSARGQKTDKLKSTLSAPQLQRVRDYIHTHLSSDLGLTALADEVQLSPYHFAHLFKNTVGMPPHHYVICERVNESQRLLATRRMSVIEIAMSLGFATQSHFTEVFRKATGTTPKHYQQEH
jgi:AraC family transcriptional regulator